MEALEDRRLLSTFIVVNNPTDTPVTGETDLRQAIGQANSTGGAETITFDPTVFASPQTITLTGGQLELSDTSGTETITGPAAGVTVSGGGTSRVFQVDSGVTADLSGLTITGGNASNDSGGGIYNNGTLTLSNSTLSGNSATYGSGGIANYAHSDSQQQHLLRQLMQRRRRISNDYMGMVTVIGSTFSSNFANEGGAIRNTGNGTMTVSDCTFSDNYTINSDGGAITNDIGATMTISNSTFSDNSAIYSGGGIVNEGRLTISASTFSQNHANTGGAIDNFGTGTLAISNSTLSGNSTVFENTTGYAGGGIYNDGTLTISNSTISGNNSAPLGGGIFNTGSSGSSLTINNSIIAGNTAQKRT